MNINLKRASLDDAGLLFEMQRTAFMPLLEKYRDFDTSPANEPISKLIERLNQDFTYFYFICDGATPVGAIRVVDFKNDDSYKWISPIFILEEYRNRGIAQKTIMLAEQIHGKAHWELETILQEKGNCYFYEKMGYKQTGRTEKINDRLTLVYYHK